MTARMCLGLCVYGFGWEEGIEELEEKERVSRLMPTLVAVGRKAARGHFA